MDDLYKVKGQARLFSTQNNKISRTVLYKKMPNMIRHPSFSILQFSGKTKFSTIFLSLI